MTESCHCIGKALHVMQLLLVYLSRDCHMTFSCMQHYTFYDFITNKARGKSGPLFSFDVHEDVRLLNDAMVEKDEVRGDDVDE